MSAKNAVYGSRLDAACHVGHIGSWKTLASGYRFRWVVGCGQRAGGARALGGEEGDIPDRCKVSGHIEERGRMKGGRRGV